MTFDYDYYPDEKPGNTDDKAKYYQEIINVASERLNAIQAQQGQQNDPPRTWSYYENLRKTNRHLYYDQKTNKQMIQDRMELGEAFMDGNFDKNVGIT